MLCHLNWDLGAASRRGTGSIEALKCLDNDHRRVTGGADEGGSIVFFGLCRGLFVGVEIVELAADQLKVFRAGVIGKKPEVSDAMET